MKKTLRKNFFLLVGTFLLLLVVHLPLLTKNILTADVLLNNFYYNGYSWEISIGRFGLFIIGLLKFYHSTPLLDLIPSFILFYFILYFLIQLFEIKSYISKFLILLIFVTSPIISATFLFHYCTIGYFISFLCGILSTYFFYKCNNKYIRVILPILMIVISLSMYQAYLSLIVTVFVFYNLKLILDKKYHYKDVFLYLLVLLFGLLFYFILMKLSLLIFHVDMSGYSNANTIGIHILLDIPRKFISAYQLFFEFFFGDSIVKNSYFHTFIYSIVLFVFMILILIQNILIKRIKFTHIVLCILLIFLLPVFLNSVIFVITDTKLQLLMSASYLIIPVFILSLDMNLWYKIFLVIVFGLLIRVHFIQVRATYISLENTFQSYNQVIHEAISIPGNHRYMILGEIDTKTSIYKKNYGFVSDLGIFWEEYNLKKLGFCKFVKYYQHKEVEFVDEETYYRLISQKEKEDIYSVNDIIIINFDNV